MWAAYGYAPASAADDTNDAFGNPVRRWVGPGADWWLEEAACCLCGCLSTGPIFIIVGMLFLLTAATDPRRDAIRQYNKDVSAWTQPSSGGMAQLASIFPAGMSVALTSLTSSTDTVPFATQLALEPQSSVSALQDNGTTISSYATSLWFEGKLPAWASWPAADAYGQLRPVNGVGAFFNAITLQLVQCANTRTTGYGDNCTAAAPGAAAAAPPPPPAAAAAAAAQGPAGAVAAAPAAGRRLAQFGMQEQSCELFLRQVRVPSAIALELVPPRGCVTAGGARCAGNWTVRAFPSGCGTSYASAQAEVAEATWIADLRSGAPPAWCANWTTALPAAVLPPPATLSVRSQYDPYSEAAAITGCTYNFGPTTVQYAAFAANLITFGVAVVTLSGCCLVALVARAASQAAARGEAAPFAGGGGGGGGGAPVGGGWGGSGLSGGYGSTGWYGAGGRGAYYG